MTPEVVGAAAQFGLPGLAVLVLGAALGRYGIEYLKTRSDRKANTPTMSRAHISEVDASMLTMARQREGMVQDLAASRAETARLLQALIECEDRGRRALAEEEARNAKRESELRAEIEHLEQKLRNLLDEVTDLKRRTDPSH